MGESLPTTGEGSGWKQDSGQIVVFRARVYPMSLVRLVSRERVDSGESLIGLCFPKENSPFSTSFPVNLTFEPLSRTNT